MAAVASLATFGNAQALEIGDSGVTVSGFGTLGAVYHDAVGVGYRRDISQADSVPAGQGSLDADSMLGVQFGARLGSKVDAALQLVSRNYLGSEYKPQVSMAYLKYKPGPDTSLRLGRLGVEMYLLGDSAEIGYANLLVRPQVIFYPRTYDGADAETTMPFGRGTLRLKAQAGWATGKLQAGGDPYDASGSPIGLALAEYAAGPWTLRASAVKLRLRNENADHQWSQLVALLGYLPNGTAIERIASMANRELDSWSLAAAYDQGPFQAMTSFSRIMSPNWPDRDELYANAGYRLGRFTPYLAYSWEHMDQTMLPTGLPDSPATAALNQAAQLAMAGVKVNQVDWAIGVRYELGKNTAIKAQVDHLRYHDPEALSDPALSTIPYASRPWKSMTLYSLALDFVF